MMDGETNVRLRQTPWNYRCPPVIRRRNLGSRALGAEAIPIYEVHSLKKQASGKDMQESFSTFGVQLIDINAVIWNNLAKQD